MSISKMPFDVCCGGDIGMCKTLPIRRWEIFGCWPNIHVLTATGEPYDAVLMDLDL